MNFDELPAEFVLTKDELVTLMEESWNHGYYTPNKFRCPKFRRVREIDIDTLLTQLIEQNKRTTEKREFLIRIPKEISMPMLNKSKEGVEYYIDNQDKFTDTECSEWVVTVWGEPEKVMSYKVMSYTRTPSYVERFKKSLELENE